MQSYAKRLTGKQVLDIMFALPSDTENSDTEQDDGAYEELNELSYNDMIDSSEPKPASAGRAARRQSSADIPAVQDDADSFCSDADGSSDDNFPGVKLLLMAIMYGVVKLTSLALSPNLMRSMHVQLCCLITSRMNVIISDHCSLLILCKILSTRLICMHSRQKVSPEGELDVRFGNREKQKTGVL